MMTYWHKCNVWSTSSTNSIPMMTTSLFLTMLAHTWSEQRMLSLPAICLRALNIGWWRPRSAVRTAKSCITQMANWLRYAFPWAMHALQMAPPRPPHTSRFIQGHGCHSWRMQHPCRMCWLQVPKGSQWWIWLCCCQHILFNEPDFVNVPSLLSSLCAETVSQPSSSPNFLPNSIPLSNVGDMQSGFIVNSHLHQPLKMSSKMLKRHLLLSLWNAFRSELTLSTPPCIALTVSTGSKIGLSIMRIVTRKVLMAVKLLGHAVVSAI